MLFLQHLSEQWFMIPQQYYIQNAKMQQDGKTTMLGISILHHVQHTNECGKEYNAGRFV